MKKSDIIKVPEIEQEFSKPSNYDDIKVDIAQRGIQEAVVVNTKNELLCGYTRLSIAEELGIGEIPHRAVDIIELDAMMEYAVLDNIHRRQLTDLQLVEYGMKLEEIHKRKVGRPENSGQNDLNLGKQTRDIVASKISEQTGVKLSGKKYERLKTIATKAVPEVKEKLNEGEITQAAALELVKLDCDEQRKIISKHRDVKDIRKVIRLKEKQEQRKQLAYNSASLSTPDSVTLYHGKMQEEGEKINDNSVDLILTDPPYGGEYLHLWDALAVFAERTLKPSGLMITYSGQLYLDKVIQSLSQHLNYLWELSLIHNQQTQLIGAINVICGWKPILIFQKEPKKKLDKTIVDLIDFEVMDKTLHDWQQGERAPVFLVEHFTEVGDVVCDPFSGVGTFLLAAYKLNRIAVGIEQSEENLNIIRGRISERRFAYAPTV